MIEVGFLGALFAGVLSMLSPCSALLLPAFFAYAFQSKQQLVVRTVVFFLGLATIMIPIGIGLGGIGGLVTEHRDTLISLGGWIMVALGVYTFFGFGFRIPGLAQLSTQVGGTGWVSVFFLGAVYGFAGFCAGPLLGAVLTTALVGSSAWYGASIMALYAFGMTVPLFVLALCWDRWNIGAKTWLTGRTFTMGKLKLNTMTMVAGLLFIGMGVLFITTHGTSTLPTLTSTDTQATLQETAGNWASQVSNAATLLIIAVIIELFLFVRLLRR
ncbi:cytochrome c biogenesis CcdA family protein [Corynebacterium freiburgense]|uniref:cytochrome c biogenesis CcdA family protein n=1 Tax=Corynebacterium freiburgense TaxID=556548 RepID=UPI0003FDC12F|nr:cytochrome c biogenesis CcdA family protein [Corynebacterium freiburgense]WJZ01499.1 Cytochrome C biogenesis protein transmembrane region [Corynebacterium freiburgense]